MAQEKIPVPENIPVPDWINNLDEGKIVKLATETTNRGSETNNGKVIREEISVNPAEATAALSSVYQNPHPESTAVSSGDESLVKPKQSPGMTTRSSRASTETASDKDISKGNDPLKVASRRWGRDPRGEGQDRSISPRKPPTPKYRRRRKRSRTSVSMVSEITRLIIKVLQLKGAMTLEALAEQLCCKQEHVQNVLNGP